MQNLTYIQYRDINKLMEERVINILLDIKADIGGIKNRLDQVETNLGGRMDRLEAEVSELKSDISEFKSDVAEIKEDMSEVKTTVNALAEGLLETSREVKQIKGKAVHA